MNTLWVEHYTNTVDWRLKPILPNIKTHHTWPSIKPVGALYTSPVDSEYGWRHWTDEERYERGRYRIVLNVDLTHCLKIDSVDDMDLLPWQTHSQLKQLHWVDYSVLVQRGVQAIWLTTEGQWATRLTYPRNLYGWDCETVAILDAACVLSWGHDHAYDGTRTSQVA
jgi:hypothetical protein